MKSLHKPVIFLGDKPNPRKNISLGIPFVGTPSYKIILEWIYLMDLDLNLVQIKNAFTLRGEPVELGDLTGKCVIVFGQDAEDRLKELGVKSYKRLPNPSPKIKPPTNLTNILLLCKNWIYGIEPVL